LEINKQLIKMFTNSKPKGIDALYIDSESKKPLVSQPPNLNLKDLCGNDHHWIYKYCMNKSKAWREEVDESHKTVIEWSADAKANEEIMAQEKKKAIGKYNPGMNAKLETTGPIFLQCSRLYYEHCKAFYEKKLAQDGKI
jgi:hypothetical protein